MIMECAWGLGDMGEFSTYEIDPETGYYTYTDYMKNSGDGLQFNRALYTLQPFMFEFMDEAEYANYSLPQHDQIFAAFSWNRDDSQRLPAHLTLTSEESARLSEIMNAVYTYFDEMVYRFILGEEDLANFDAFRAQLAKLGIEEACAIYQSAYDRYIAR